MTPGESTSHLTTSTAPGKYVIIGDDEGLGYYYEVQVFTKVVISGVVVTLSDSNGATYIATTTTCPAACSGGYCHPEIGCLSTTCSCSSLCYCSGNDGVCTSCKDSAYSLVTKCKCKTGFILNAGSCVFGNFYIDGPLHCVDGTSKTVCTQCEANYFLYDDGASTVCLGCDSCDTCSSSSCYLCTSSIVQDGSTCRVDTIGYKLSFSSPNIMIDFAHPLAKGLKIGKLSATTKSNQDISTTSWVISGSSTPKQYQVVTDLALSQLPINLDFTFEKDS